jgi:hypothetical protein
MQDGFADRMTPDAARDVRLLGDFTAIYCHGRHRGNRVAPLVSPGADMGVYGRRVPVVCDECAELLRYGEQRRVRCPKDPKPFCSNCETHCYRPEMRERMRDVMRYAGPRSLFTRHVIDGVRHVLEGRAAKRKTAARAATHNEETR